MFELIFNIYNVLVVIVGGGAVLWCYDMYKKTHSRPLLNCLPGVFTSLGLLGTFVSICWSLHGVDGQNMDIMEIVKDLIPAFTSSIAGLICALGVTIWTKSIFADEEFKENAALLNKRPEEYIQQVAQQSTIINNLLVELIQLQRDQDEKNLQYNDKLNNNINNQSAILKKFIDDFVNRMDEIFQQMNGAIKHQIQTFGEEQFSKTSELLVSITQNLSNVSNDIINSQSQSVETMMNNTNEEVKGITNSVTTVLNRLSEQIQGALSTMGTEQANRFNVLLANYDNLATKLFAQNTEFAGKVTAQMQTEYEKVQSHNLESLKQMVDLRSVYQDTTAEILSNTLTMNENVTKNLRESMGEFVTNVEKSISEQCDSLGTAITANVESLNKAYNFIETLVAEIRQNYDQAVLSYGDAVNVAHRNNEASEKMIKATNNSLKNVEETNLQIGKVLDILIERQENIEHLTKQINQVSATIIELQNLENMLNKLQYNK